MSGWLLDTNVISELRRPRPSARVRSFVAGQRLEDLFVSTVTFAEIRFGIEAVGDPIRRAELNDWLLHRVRPMFDQRVLEVSEDVMFKWLLLVEEGRPATRADGRDPRYRRLQARARPVVESVGRRVVVSPFPVRLGGADAAQRTGSL